MPVHRLFCPRRLACRCEAFDRRDPSGAKTSPEPNNGTDLYTFEAPKKLRFSFGNALLRRLEGVKHGSVRRRVFPDLTRHFLLWKLLAHPPPAPSASVFRVVDAVQSSKRSGETVWLSPQRRRRPSKRAKQQGSGPANCSTPMLRMPPQPRHVL